MAYDASQALQSYYGLKEEDPAAGLVPLTSSLIPPLVAQAFGLPSLGSAAPPPPPPPAHHTQSAYGSLVNPALLGAFGFGGAQYAAAVQQQSQLASVPLGYLQALAAASQQQHHQQQQQQQQHHQQQQTAAALLHAHTAALAAAARSAPASSSALSQPHLSAPSADTSRAAPCEPERTTTTSATTNSSAPKAPAPQSYTNSAGAAPYQNPLHSLYAAAALAQQHAAYGAAPSASYAAALGPYAASHLHSAYYARPPDATAAAAAAAAAAGAYGYPQVPLAGPYGGAFHPGYGAPPLDYTAALLAAYRPVAAPSLPSAAAGPSGAPQASQSVGLGEDDTADDGSTRAIKRPRLVWTPQLHRKFEAAVVKLGVEKAVPKTIMQEMNIDGLTRENVASHLQKYRMLRRKDATSSEGRDSDTRTAGSKRSEPDAPRTDPPRPAPTPSPSAPPPALPAAPAAAARPADAGGGAASPVAPVAAPAAVTGVAVKA